ARAAVVVDHARGGGVGRRRRPGRPSLGLLPGVGPPVVHRPGPRPDGFGEPRLAVPLIAETDSRGRRSHWHVTPPTASARGPAGGTAALGCRGGTATLGGPPARAGVSPARRGL